MRQLLNQVSLGKVGQMMPEEEDDWHEDWDKHEDGDKHEDWDKHEDSDKHDVGIKSHDGDEPMPEEPSMGDMWVEV